MSVSSPVWLKYGDEYQQFHTSDKGAVNLVQVAKHFGLDIDSIQLDNVLHSRDKEGFSFGSIPAGKGASPESSIIVKGRPDDGGSVDGFVPELLEGIKAYNEELLGLKASNEELLKHFQTDLEGEDERTGFLYSKFLAKKLGLEAPYEQYGLYASTGAGLFLLGRNLYKASQLLEVQACTDAAQRLDLQDMGDFTDQQVRRAAKHAAAFRARGVAAGVGVPFLWLAWRFAMRDGSSGSTRNKGKTAR